MAFKLLIVQAAFCFGGSLPTSAASVVSGLAVGNGFGAVITADAGEALLVELVERHVVLLDVVPNIFASPIGHGTEFDYFVLRIPAERAHLGTLFSLRFPDSGDPDIISFEVQGHRDDFADLAAQVRVFLPKSIAKFCLLSLH